jgi:hypothetical protein
VETEALTSPLRVSGPRDLELRVNGKNVTRRLKAGRGPWRVVAAGLGA